MSSFWLRLCSTSNVKKQKLTLLEVNIFKNIFPWEKKYCKKLDVLSYVHDSTAVISINDKKRLCNMAMKKRPLILYIYWLIIKGSFFLCFYNTNSICFSFTYLFSTCELWTKRRGYIQQWSDQYIYFSHNKHPFV